jgi:hypothetical protein
MCIIKCERCLMVNNGFGRGTEKERTTKNIFSFSYLSYQNIYLSKRSLEKKVIYDIEGCIANIIVGFDIIDNGDQLLMLALPLILTVRH